jgi:hypothetical protein
MGLGMLHWWHSPCGLRRVLCQMLILAGCRRRLAAAVVATASGDRLSIRRNPHTSFAAASDCRTIAIYEYTPLARAFHTCATAGWRALGRPAEFQCSRCTSRQIWNTRPSPRCGIRSRCVWFVTANARFFSAATSRCRIACCKTVWSLSSNSRLSRPSKSFASR